MSTITQHSGRREDGFIVPEEAKLKYHLEQIIKARIAVMTIEQLWALIGSDLCPRCHVGTDNNGDGNCAVCCKLTEEQIKQYLPPPAPPVPPPAEEHETVEEEVLWRPTITPEDHKAADDWWDQVKPENRERAAKTAYITKSAAIRDLNTQNRLIHSRLVEDLAMTVRRLIRDCQRNIPNHKFSEGAWDFLVRKGLQGSPLRSVK